jgi:hypothetical protein
MKKNKDFTEKRDKVLTNLKCTDDELDSRSGKILESVELRCIEGRIKHYESY